MKFKSVIVLLFCAVILTSCGCKHEWEEATCLMPKTCVLCEVTEGERQDHIWVEADCENAKTCTLCGENQGEALGHIWQSATCLAPETCTRCGKTQGTTLEHMYGDWIGTGNKTMHRVCEDCGTEETAPLDYEVILRHKLTGHWDFHSTAQYDAYGLDKRRRYYLRFGEDNTGVLYFDGIGEKPFTWTFDECELQEEVVYYSFVLEIEEHGKQQAMFVDMDEETKTDLLVLTFADDYIALSANSEVAEAMVGNWACASHGEVHTMTFNADRTVTGSLMGKEIVGNWYLMPEYIEKGERSSVMVIQYTEDEETKIEDTWIDLGRVNKSLKDYLEEYTFDLFFNDRYNDCQYRRLNEKQIAALEVAVEEGRQKLIGPWTSVYVINYDTHQQMNTKEYSITFSEDGTYTAVLEKGEYTGTWTFTEPVVESYRMDGSWVYYHYDFTVDSVEDSLYGFIDTDGKFCLSSPDWGNQVYFTHD